MAKYQIWDKKSQVVTPVGKILTSAEWKEKYPISEYTTTVLADGEVNGAFFGILSQMKKMAEEQGADFSGATTDEEVLQVIEEWESRPEPTPEPIVADETRIADALEDLVVLTELGQEVE